MIQLKVSKKEKGCFTLWSAPPHLYLNLTFFVYTDHNYITSIHKNLNHVPVFEKLENHVVIKKISNKDNLIADDLFRSYKQHCIHSI